MYMRDRLKAALARVRDKAGPYFAGEMSDYRGRSITREKVLADFDVSVHRFLDLLALVPTVRGAKVLDIGISYGFYDILLKEEFGMSVVGADVEANIPVYGRMLAARGIDVLPCDIAARKLPFPDGSMDIVIFSEVVEHLRVHPIVAFREIGRVLRAGGCMVLSTPNVARFTNIVKLARGINIVEEFDETFPGNGRAHVTDTMMHIREYTSGEMEACVMAAGMMVEKVCMSRAWDGYNYFGEKLSTAGKALSAVNSLVTRFAPRLRSFIMLRAVK